MNRIQEKEAKQEQSSSFWQRYKASKNMQLGMFIGMTVLLCTVLAALMFTVLKPSFIYEQLTPEQIQATFEAAKSERDNQSLTKPQINPVQGKTSQLDTIVLQVLNDMNKNGWDEKEKTTLINWRRDDLQKVNCSLTTCDERGKSTRQDHANDLRLLQNMYWYKLRHPGDTSMDAAIARLLPTVKQAYGNTTINKGWVYYTLLRIKEYSKEPEYWDKTIQNWAEAQYKQMDRNLGVHHGPTETVAGAGSVTLEDAYRVDHGLETGLALYDAGTRYKRPDWMLLGRQGVDTVIKQAYSKQYHLFGRIYLIKDAKYGENKLFDPQARMGEIGQSIEALIRTGVYTNNQGYLTLAKEMIDGLQSSQLHDKANGGFYFKTHIAAFIESTANQKAYKAGEVETSYKEARQLHFLSALHLANMTFNNRWSALEQEMVRVASEKFFQGGAVPGYMYRVLPDGKVYPCETCAPAKSENWVTAEANNIALEALQTVLNGKIK